MCYLPPAATLPPQTLSLTSNDEVTLVSGQYHFDSIRADSNTRITIVGPATIVADQITDLLPRWVGVCLENQYRSRATHLRIPVSKRAHEQRIALKGDGRSEIAVLAGFGILW